MSNEPDLQFASLLRTLVREEIQLALREAPHDQPVEQANSPLGRRTHIAAVRRRIANGSGGAWKIGRKYLLSSVALQEEIDRHGTLPNSRKREQEVALDDELGIVDNCSYE